MRSEGQVWALEQLDEIARASGEWFEVVEIIEPAAEGLLLSVTISVDLSRYERKPGGIPFRARERLLVKVPADFPLDRPSLYFTHKNYADFSHVQWGEYICLYQAPETEWQPADGMFGFLTRVDVWLRAAAASELDPVGLPLHPPTAYSTSNLRVVPCEDTPVPEPPFWAGYVRITKESEYVIELGSWVANSDPVPDGRLAAAILLPASMPHEYPATMMDLLKHLIAIGIPIEILRLSLTLGALRTGAGQPVIFVLGAAMRGTAGGERKQHLACWRIDAERGQKLCDAALASTPENPIDIDEFYAWAVEAKIEWCQVLEDRPEIVERRDSETPAAWWTGKIVAIVGCGAIGSGIAMMAARAGAKKLQLYDSAVVKPGILVRQQFDRYQIGYGKAQATALNVKHAIPRVETVHHHSDFRTVLRDDEKRSTLLEADVMVDATASRTVAVALERRFGNSPKGHPPLLTMTLGHDADRALMTLATATSEGMSLDVDRRSKIAFANSNKGKPFLDEFWPVSANRQRLFQPEPGCSDPTFRGSAADVLGLSSRMFNVAAAWLSDAEQPRHRGYALDLSNRRPEARLPAELEFEWPPDDVLTDLRHGYRLRLSRAARSAILSWIRRSERVRGPRVETGGILFGEADEFLRVIWIDEACGPPPDSVASEAGFVCGVEGVQDLHAEKIKRTRGSVRFVGMWHTHPGGMPIPSQTDRSAMAQLLRGNDFLGRQFLMLIVGGSAANALISGNVFKRAEYER
jgi:integrative and conjugative element protein (TIGR02256 family)